MADEQGFEAFYIGNTGDPLSPQEFALLDSIRTPLAREAKKRGKIIAFKLSERTTAVFLKQNFLHLTKKTPRLQNPLHLTGHTSAGGLRGYGRYNEGTETFFNWEDFGTNGDRFNELRVTSPAQGIAGTFDFTDSKTDFTAGFATNFNYLEFVRDAHIHFLSSDTDFIQGDLTIQRQHINALVGNAMNFGGTIELRIINFGTDFQADPTKSIDIINFLIPPSTYTPVFGASQIDGSVISGDIIHIQSGVNTDRAVTFSILQLLNTFRVYHDETAILTDLINAPFTFDFTVVNAASNQITFPPSVFIDLIQQFMTIQLVMLKSTGAVSFLAFSYLNVQYRSNPRPDFIYELLSAPNRTPEEIIAIQASTGPFPYVDGDVVRLSVTQGTLTNFSGFNTVLVNVAIPRFTRYLFSEDWLTDTQGPLFTGGYVPRVQISTEFVGYQAPIHYGLYRYNSPDSTGAVPFGDNWIFRTTGGAWDSVEVYQLTAEGAVPYGNISFKLGFTRTLTGTSNSHSTETVESLFFNSHVNITRFVDNVFFTGQGTATSNNYTVTPSIPENGFNKVGLSYALTGETYRYDQIGSGFSSRFLRKWNDKIDAIAVLSNTLYDYSDENISPPDFNNLSTDFDVKGQMMPITYGLFQSDPVNTQTNSFAITPQPFGGQTISHGGSSSQFFSRYWADGFSLRNGLDEIPLGFLPHVEELRGFITYTSKRFTQDWLQTRPPNALRQDTPFTIPLIIHFINETGNEIGRIEVFRYRIESILKAYIDAQLQASFVINLKTDPKFTIHMNAEKLFDDFVPTLDEAGDYVFKLTDADKAALDTASAAKIAIDNLLQTEMAYNDFASYEMLNILVSHGDTFDLYLMIDTSTEI